MAFTDLVKGTVEVVVLRLLRERPMYGYEIIKVVNDRTDNALAWKEGTLYPCLHRLEGAGIVTGEWSEAENGKRRKYYRLTRRGEALCEERSTEWAAFSRAMSAVLCEQTA